MSVKPHTVYVYNYRLDGYGHVNNARYLEFLEEARWAFFRELGLRAALREVDLVVAQMTVRYRSAAVLDDELHIFSKIIQVQSRQVKMAQRIIRVADQKLLLEAELVLLPTAAAAKVVRLPEKLAEKLTLLIEQ